MRKRMIAKFQEKCLRRFRKRQLYPFELREQLARSKIAGSQIACKFVSWAISLVVSLDGLRIKNTGQVILR